MRVLVTGSRNWRDRGFVFRILDQFHARNPISVVIEGECPFGGVDLYARQWGESRGIPVEPYPADWLKHICYVGSRCRSRARCGAQGPARNRRMLVEGKPDLVLAFPGGSGTGNMKLQARTAGVPVTEIPHPQESILH